MILKCHGPSAKSCSISVAVQAFFTVGNCAGLVFGTPRGVALYELGALGECQWVCGGIQPRSRDIQLASQCAVVRVALVILVK